MRNLQFDEMTLFVRVAELGSLSAIARERGVPVSQVSRTLARVEAACNARLVNRSTHGLSLTEEGRSFLEYSRKALDALEEMEAAFATSAGQPSGVVRAAASSLFALHQLIPSLPGLAERHPRLQIDLVTSDRVVDLARDAIDLSIRTVNYLPGSVIARQIGTLGRGLYAAPFYARSRGLPSRPEELAAHALVTNSAVAAINDWPFRASRRRHDLVERRMFGPAMATVS